MISWERIKHLLIKEFIQLLRDPRMRFALIMPPIIQLLIFGYAVSTDVKHITTAVYDLDNTRESREIIAQMEASSYFTVKEWIKNESEIKEALDRSRVSTVIQINHGFGNDLKGGKPTHIQVLVDGTDSNTARIALGYVVRIIAHTSNQQIAARLITMNGQVKEQGQIDLQSRAWFNENLESRNFFIPGVIAMIVMLISLMLTSMAIVREKEIGTIEQIMVSPLRPIELILGKTIPFALVGLFDVVLISTIGVYWFDIPIRGSILLLFFATVLFLMNTLGVGLFISTISSTQQQAMMTTSFFHMPAMLLSGFLYPIANMPLIIQWITYLNPLQYFLVVTRGIFLKGVGLETLWPQLLALAILGTLVMALATRRFKKVLE